MSLAADALQPSIVAGLTTVEGRPTGGSLADLIGKKSKVGYDLSFDESSRAIIADFRGSEPVLISIASDSARFATASFQSISSVPAELLAKESIGWGLIRSYYSAFYAGHAALRFFGESCSFFDRSHMSHISGLAAVYGRTPEFRLDKGTYHCKLNASAALIECRNLRNSAGGSHESFWDVFGVRLKLISEDVLQGALLPSEAQLVFAKLEALQRSISGHGAPFHSWLSVIRNEIQYRHYHDVWFPCGVRKNNRQQLSRLAEQWRRDPMDIDVGTATVKPLGEFVVTCAFIVALCRVLLTRIAERSPESVHSFATLGPLAYLRDAGLI